MITSFDTFIVSSTQKELYIIVTDTEHNLQILQNMYMNYQNSSINSKFTPSIIILCACSLPVESYTTAWSLSHEFAHFILQYKGEAKNVYTNWVDDAESQITHCISNTHDIYNCHGLWTYIKSDSGKLMFMLPIHPNYE